MRVVDLDGSTEPTFLRCLHDEEPDDPRVISLRMRWLEAKRAKGFLGKIVLDEGSRVVGLGQALPIEETHLSGRNLLAILCLWVHGYEHHVGPQQGRGYGRALLEALEQEADDRNLAGLAAWGMDFEYWNPVSFYEHMGYERADKDGMAVLVWKRLKEDADPPAFHHQEAPLPPAKPGRVSVYLFLNGWCTGACGQCITVRDSLDGLEDLVDHREIDTSDPENLRRFGISNGLYVDGEPYRPYEPPPSAETIRKDILDLAAAKGLGRIGPKGSLGL